MEARRDFIVGLVITVVVVAIGIFLWSPGGDISDEWVVHDDPSGYSIAFPSDWDIDTSQRDYPADTIFTVENDDASSVLVFIDESRENPTSNLQELDALAEETINRYMGALGHNVEEAEIISLEENVDSIAYFMRGTFANQGGSLMGFSHYSIIRNDGTAFVARANYNPENKGTYVEGLAEAIVTSLEFAE